MIRSLLLAAGFLVITASLLFLQPSPRDTTAPYGDLVTRADTAPSQNLATIEQNAGSSLAWSPNQDLASTSGAHDQASFDATSPATRVTALTGHLPGADPRPSTIASLDAFLPVDGDDVQLKVAAMSRNIMLELLAPADPSQHASFASRDVRGPTATYVSALRHANTTGQSVETLLGILQRATLAGELSPDPAFYTALGDVDYPSLLALHIPELASPPTAPARQDFVYRIQPTDSLASLALLFYGDSAGHGAILDANRRVLSAANDITPGILLTIPATYK